MLPRTCVRSLPFRVSRYGVIRLRFSRRLRNACANRKPKPMTKTSHGVAVQRGGATDAEPRLAITHNPSAATYGFAVISRFVGTTLLL